MITQRLPLSVSPEVAFKGSPGAQDQSVECTYAAYGKGFLSAVVPASDWLRIAEMPQKVRLVIVGMVAMRSGFALIPSEGVVVTAHEEFPSGVTVVSLASNKHPDENRASELNEAA